MYTSPQLGKDRGRTLLRVKSSIKSFVKTSDLARKLHTIYKLHQVFTVMYIQYTNLHAIHFLLSSILLAILGPKNYLQNNQLYKTGKSFVAMPWSILVGAVSGGRQQKLHHDQL